MKLMIYCAGGAGREIYDLAERINAQNNQWGSIEFIDDVRIESKYYGCDVHTFSYMENIKNKKDHQFVIAIGEPLLRESLWNKITDRGFGPVSLIDPTAIISKTAKIGKGVLIQSFVMISSDTDIKDNVFFQSGSGIGHDTVISEHTVICPLSVIAGNCIVGKRSFIGIGAAIKEKTTIGDDVIVGMGTAVYRNVKTNSVIIGNPGRVVKRSESMNIFGSRTSLKISENDP
jgi:sugar O-acyltransferase (sialic acid O-acetyltransferase NeuD family)